MNAIELRHLRYFVAVAEELHFGRAAARLSVAQPSVSQQIRELERRIGVPLLLRSSRRVELLPAGAAFLASSRRVLAEVDRAADAARFAKDGTGEVFRLGYSDSAALSVLPSLLPRLRGRHPSLRLVLEEASTQVQLDALGRDAIDLALVRGPVPAEGLVIEVVHREPFMVALRVGHRLARRAAIPLRLLADEAVISFPRHLAPGFHDLMTGMCHLGGLVPRVVHETAAYQTMMSLVAAGVGVSIVPASVRNLGRKGVSYRPVRGGEARAEIVAVYREPRRGPLVEDVVRLARHATRRR